MLVLHFSDSPFAIDSLEIDLGYDIGISIDSCSSLKLFFKLMQHVSCIRPNKHPAAPEQWCLPEHCAMDV